MNAQARRQIYRDMYSDKHAERQTEQEIHNSTPDDRAAWTDKDLYYYVGALGTACIICIPSQVVIGSMIAGRSICSITIAWSEIIKFIMFW